MRPVSVPDGFYTMKGYSLLSGGRLTSAMEDYLEMIARIGRGGAPVHVGELSARLHVKASSVTKMMRQLAQAGLVRAPRYGEIALSEEGALLGSYLLHRHDVVHRFLCWLNHSEDELEQAEKIEHFLKEETVKNLELLIKQLQKE